MRFSSRVVRWFSTPLKTKIYSIYYRSKYLIFILSVFVFSILIKFFRRIKILRKIYFHSQRKNTFLASETNKEYFLVNTSDVTIGGKTFVEKEAYEFEKLNLISNLLPSGHKKRLIIDIGANIGTTCIKALKENIFQKAIAVEPDPNNFLLLKTNIVLNNLSDRAIAYNYALSNEDNKKVLFELSESNHGDHRVRNTKEEGLYGENKREEIKVNTTTLNNICVNQSKNETLVWIDTQGFEGYVLDGGKKIIESGIPICLEFWPYGLKRSSCYDLLINNLKLSNYKTIIDLDSPSIESPFSIERIEEIANKLGFDGSHTDLLIK